ncbi:MAG: hypothetical protein J6Q29_02765 [Alistipes sp.]|nr:hypothetical protein [Alistipes sp.]
MKSKIRYIFATLLVLVVATAASAQENMKMVLGVDFDTYFDNTEYTGTNLAASSGTIFSSRLSPKIGVEWDERNSLVFGVDLFNDFGNDTQFFSKARPQIYYRFATPKVKAYAGIFDRKEMVGYYSELFFSDRARFFENRVQGVMGQYVGERGYVELSVDWCGMYSMESRERFRVLSAGRYDFGRNRIFYAGYALQMFHFAGSEAIIGSVVDNVIVNPYVGANFNAFFDFDIKLHGILTVQRDRAVEDYSHKPGGGLLQIRMSKWGLYLDEQIYVGDNLMPYYYSAPNNHFANGYGSELYAGSTLFGTKPYWRGDGSSNTFYDTRIGYSNSFFNDTVRLNAFFAFQCDGENWGTRQMLELKINLWKDISFQKKR